MELTLIVLAVLATVIATISAAMSWRLVREERRRSDVRVAALAAAIQRPPDDAVPPAPIVPGRAAIGIRAEPARPVERTEPAPAASWPAPDVHAAEAPSPLFAAAEPAENRSRVAGAVGAGALVVAAVIALILLLDGRSNSPAAAAARHPESATTATASTPTTAAPGPIELVALSHDRQADRLTVRGVVRNPAGAAPVSDLTAVVLLFDQNGAFLTSSRTAVRETQLTAGSETTFVVTVPGASEVGRYRVSFRQGDSTVPHVDTRSS